MELEDEINRIEKKAKKNEEKINKQSFAFEMLRENTRDLKQINKRLIIVIILLILINSITVGYLVYVLNDIGIEETTTTTTKQEIEDVDSIDNSYIINGDNYGENKTN